MNFRLSQNFYSSIFACLAAHTFFCCGAAIAGDVEAISIKQTHTYFGKLTVTIAPDALRLDDKNGQGFVLVARAPDWNVNIFRDADKLFFTESFAKFAGAGLVNELILPRKEAAFRGDAAGEETKIFMGFPVRFSRFPTPFEFLPLPKNYDHKLYTLAASALRTRPVEGLPLTQVSLIKSDIVGAGVMNNHQQRDLTTTSAVKVKVSSDIFDAPKNYAKAKSLQEVVAGPNSKEQSDTLQDLLGPDPSHK